MQWMCAAALLHGRDDFLQFVVNLFGIATEIGISCTLSKKRHRIFLFSVDREENGCNQSRTIIRDSLLLSVSIDERFDFRFAVSPPVLAVCESEALSAEGPETKLISFSVSALA